MEHIQNECVFVQKSTHQDGLEKWGKLIIDAPLETL